jgi:hypothetical protein
MPLEFLASLWTESVDVIEAVTQVTDAFCAARYGETVLSEADDACESQVSAGNSATSQPAP